MADLIWKGPGVLERRSGEPLAYPGDRIDERKLDPKRVQTMLSLGHAAYVKKGESHGQE